MSKNTENEGVSDSYLGNIHNFLDRHINIVRYASFAVAGVGVVILGRSIRVATKFASVKNIPLWMIEKQVRLQGTVKHVDQEGILHVDHIPIIAIPTLKTVSSNLGVKIAGVKINSDGQLWLKSHLCDKRIWITMLTVDTSTNHLQSIVKVKKGWQRYTNVNEHIIKEGLGTVDLGFKMSVAPKHAKDIDFLVNLLKIEEDTKRKRMTRKEKAAERMEIFYNFMRNVKDKLFKK